MIALDYTSAINPTALKAVNASDVFRYLCFSPKGDWKTIRQPEYDQLMNAGIGVTLNWEFDARDWNNTQTVGFNHGKEAVRQAHNLGYPVGCTIFGSADYDMPWGDWTARGQHYATGFAAVLRDSGYEPGVYGPWNVLTWCRDSGQYRRFWQAGMSYSWSSGKNANVWPGAHLRQRRHMTVAGQDTDMNDILIPEWGQARRGHAMADDWGRVGAPMAQFLQGLQDRNIRTVYEADSWFQEMFGFSPWDGVSPSHRSRLIQEIHNAVVGVIPGTVTEVSLTAEDRARIDRLAGILEKLAEHLK